MEYGKIKLSKYSATLILSLILMLFITACQDEIPDGGGVNPGDPTNPMDTTVTVNPSGNEQYLTLDSDFIFDQDRLYTYELVIPQADYDFLNNDPTAEEYVEGTLIFEGDTISPVGVRYKGSIGAFVNCTSGNNWADPSGSKTCTKLSMKVKINWDGADYKFYGLNKLQFHSQNLDDSQLRERLGYWLFGEMNVPAPRSVHAKLIINGAYVGLFALTEQIDGRFDKYHFENGEGNLYKEIWPTGPNEQVPSEQAFMASLKTNEDENPSFDIIRNIGQKILDAAPNEMANIIEESMDINEILSYAVVDRTIRHDDGPFHYYCEFFGDCTNHNFYWYEDPVTQKIHLIAWDLDNAFENIISNSNPVTPVADGWGEISNNCDPFSVGGFGLLQLSAACDPMINAWTQYDTKYQTLLKQFKEGPLSQEKVDEQLDKWIDQINLATMEASELHGDAITIGQWNQSVAQLRDQLTFARNN